MFWQCYTAIIIHVQNIITRGPIRYIQLHWEKGVENLKRYWYKKHFFHFLIVFPNRGDESGLECCYDNNGNLLIWPPAAGTADVISPRIFNNPFLHYLHDQLPAIHCCGAPAASISSCQVYYIHRPSDNCFRFNPNPPGMNVLCKNKSM